MNINVFLFKDYLKVIHGDPLQKSQIICEISAIDDLPDGLVQIDGRLARVCMLSRDDSRVYIEFMKEIPKKDSINFSHNITCPHCGDENTDSWEASDNDDESHCDNCGSIFSYERDVEVTYSSVIVDRNDKVTELT